MDLPNLLNKLKHNQDEPQQFLAIEISPSVVKAAIWQASGVHTEIVALGSNQAWESETEDDLLTAIDASISDASSQSRTEPDQVIFGLPETWVKNDGLADAHKKTLKTICQKLALEPVGFVVTTEALVQYLKNIEGGPISAILINLSADEIAVTLVKLGKIVGTHTVGRSPTLSADVLEGIARFPSSQDALPSRMILYNGKDDVESAKQELISFDWQDQLPFLHFPKIEAIDAQDTIKAVSLSGGTEVIKSQVAAQAEVADSASAPALQKAGPQPRPSNETSDLDTSSPTEKPTPAFSAPTPPLEKEEEESKQAAEPDEMAAGFTDIDVSDLNTTQDFNEMKEKKDTPTINSPANEPVSAEESNVEPVSAKDFFTQAKKDTPDEPQANPLSKVFETVTAPLSLFRPRRFKLGGNKLPYIIGGVVLALILVTGGAVAAYYQLPKAQVTLYLNLRDLKREVEFTLDPNQSDLNLESSVLPADRQTITATAENQISTTGTATVGERASGTVTLFNRTTSPKTFAAGTELTTGNLTFTLNDDVALASASATENNDFSVTIEPSQTEASVTAADIGSDYNIDANTTLNVANFSQESYVARAKSAFTGGSSHEVPAVSQEDRSTLKEQVMEELEAKASQQVAAQTAGRGVITTNEQEITDEEFSAAVGEQTNTLRYSVTAEQVVYTYEQENLSILAQKQLVDEVPDNYLLKPDNTTVKVLDSEVTEDGEARIRAEVNLRLLPKHDQNEIARTIAGKSIEKAEPLLKQLNGFNRVETKITPVLPGPLATFPHKQDNITIRITNAD